MFDNLFCDNYHPGELIRAVCCNSVCECMTRFACGKCVRDEIHGIDKDYKFGNLIQAQKVEDKVFALYCYSEIKFDMIADEVLKNQVKILKQAAQILEDSFQQIEQLENLFNQAYKIDQEEVGSRNSDDFIYDIAIIENKNVLEKIDKYKDQLFSIHEEAKNYDKQTQKNNNINNKQVLLFIDYLQQQVKDKQDIAEKYGKQKQNYERFYLQQELIKLKQNVNQEQNPSSQDTKNMDKLIGNISQICHQCNRNYAEDSSDLVLKQDIKQNQFDFLSLGDSYFNKQELRAAKSAYKLEIKQNPDNPLGFKKLGECLISEKKFMKAIRYYDDFKGSELEQIGFQILKAKILQKNDKLKEARTLLFNLLQRYPQIKYIRDELGNVNYLCEKRGL